MIIVLGEVVADEATIDEVLAESLTHVRRSRTEPGCLSHDVARDAEAPYRLLFVERWASQEDLHRHFTVPESGAFGAALVRLCGDRVAMSTHEVPD